MKRFAIWIGVVDQPNQRKVHTKVMPRLGGLAIYLAFVVAFIIMLPQIEVMDAGKRALAWALFVGGSMIALLGAVDDKYNLSPKIKFLVQIIAAIIVVVGFDLRIDFINIPFLNAHTLPDWFSIPFTIFWIVGVTNAVNLIDGLDGLAAGVSAIATATLLVMAIFMGNEIVIILTAILLGSILGFLVYNFHPAKIFMGDSGALFLGFCLATLSISGFKQAAVVSFVAPLLILGVPITDTLFAIVRRIVNKTPISEADKNHLHHRLMSLGLSHLQTVLVIYLISISFGILAILLSNQPLWVTLVILPLLLLFLQLGAEYTGIISQKQPVIHFLRRTRMKVVQLLGSTRMMK